MSNTNTRGVYSMLRLVHFSRTLSVNEQTRKKSDTCEILRRKGEGGRAVPQMKRERKERVLDVSGYAILSKVAEHVSCFAVHGVVHEAVISSCVCHN